MRFFTINGKQRSLWRAVDQVGNVLDILVLSSCKAGAYREGSLKVLLSAFDPVDIVCMQ